MSTRVYPKYLKEVVNVGDLRDRLSNGWTKGKKISPNEYLVSRPYSKDELLEIKIRTLFKEINFDHIIEPENFHYTDLGYQIDVCGGIDDTFIVMDCTTREKLGNTDLRNKINDNAAKINRIKRNVKRLYPKYKYILFAICTQDINLEPGVVDHVRDSKILMIDVGFFEKNLEYVDLLGNSLRYQIVKRLSERTKRRETSINIIETPALKILSGRKHYYNFTISPEKMLRLGYVYRMEESNERGYQRPILKSKIENINEFLKDNNNYFTSSLVVGFDHNKLVFKRDKHSGRSRHTIFGRLLIPEIYCSAEIIDGQHRLYGYLSSSEDRATRRALEKRRTRDLLSVNAIEDPRNEIKPALFLDINSNQTKINTRQIWSLMAVVRPKTLMGYISNIVYSLSQKDIFKNKISIPNRAKGNPLNVANFGKSISDLKLVHKPDLENRLFWNLFDGPEDCDEYPNESTERPVKVLTKYFEAIKESNPNDWKKRSNGFLCTNNGINVMLRVLVQVLIYFDTNDLPLTKKEFIKTIRTGLSNYFQNKDVNKLRRVTSNEGERERVATDIIYEIHKIKHQFANSYLVKKRRIRN